MLQSVIVLIHGLLLPRVIGIYHDNILRILSYGRSFLILAPVDILPVSQAPSWKHMRQGEHACQAHVDPHNSYSMKKGLKHQIPFSLSMKLCWMHKIDFQEIW